MNQNKYTRHATHVNSDWTIWQASSAEKITFPFEGNTDAYIMEQDFTGYSDYYLDNLPKIGSPHPSYSGLFFTGDSPLQDLGGEGAMKTTRTYAILPGFISDNANSSSVRIEAESYVWTKPGINSVSAEGKFWGAYRFYVDNTLTGSDATNVVLSTQANPFNGGTRYPHDVNSNYLVATVYYAIYDPVFGISSYEYQPTIVSRTTTAITVPRVSNNASGTGNVQYVWFSRPQIKINPRPKVVQSYKYYSYWLPGLNCTDVSTIPIEQPFRILDSNQNETDAVSETTTPPLYTNGNGTGYYNMVASNTKILVDYPTIRRWKGNIFEKESRYIIIV